MAIANPDNKFSVAKFIVDPVAGNGTHTTIASALAAASSGDDIFIRPGTYTENLTVKAGVSLVAWTADLMGNVTIVGTLSATISGTANFSGIRFQTNGSYILVTGGASVSVLNFYNCFWNCTNFTGANNANSNASSLVNFYDCAGDIGVAGSSFFTSSTSTVAMYRMVITNSGGTTTPISFTSGTFQAVGLDCRTQIQLSSSGQINFSDSVVDTSALNISCVVGIATSGSSFAMNCRFASGTASTLSVISAHTLRLINCAISSSNANTITGSGTLVYSNIVFYGSSSGMSVTTQTPILAGPGAGKGLVTGTPGAGFIGEQIRSALGSGTPIALTNAIAQNIVSVNLTAGIWDVTGVVMFKGAVTGTASGASIGTTASTVGTQGDNYVTTPTVSTAIDLGVVVPPYRISLTATTTVYLVAICLFTAGSSSAYGRISATRVG